MLCYPPVCDARYKCYRNGLWNGVIEEGEFVEPEDQDQVHFAEQGKLSSELAFIYIYFGSHVLLIKSISDLCGVCHKSYDSENPFPKYKYIILTPYMEILAGISFSNYRMGKILFTQNSFENTCVVMECRDVGVEVEKWRMEMFMKNAHCVLVL